MIGFGIGGILMGRLADRFGVMWPLLIGSAGLGVGFIVAGMAGSMLQFSLAQGLLIGLLGTVGDLRAAGGRHLACGSRAGAASRWPSA